MLASRGIAVAQAVIVPDCSRTLSLHSSSAGSAAMPKSRSRCIVTRGMCIRVQCHRMSARAMLGEVDQEE